MGELDEDGQKSRTSSYEISIDSLWLTMIQLTIFWLYNGVKVINIPQKLYFAFWILILFPDYWYVQ